MRSLLKNRLLKFVIRRAARAHGFLDPFHFLSQLEAFARPSEVSAPIELIRAGVVFHARGLMNTKVIQSNLDWNWPYWIRQQFDPRSRSFIPRSFSITHVNLTHRNWTAVGVPGVDSLPIVDPRGLVTPHFDSWSLNVFAIDSKGNLFDPAQAKEATQRYLLAEDTITVHTQVSRNDLHLETRVTAEVRQGAAIFRIRATATGNELRWIGLGVRPFNPEGIASVRQLEASANLRTWRVNKSTPIRFRIPPDAWAFSNFDGGDVLNAAHLGKENPLSRIECRAGLASGAALFVPQRDGWACSEAVVPMAGDVEKGEQRVRIAGMETWAEALRNSARLRTPHKKWKFLYDAALRTLVLHAPGDVYPGPYTYKRFWFRDAAFIANALIGVGMLDRARRAIGRFSQRQDVSGYFRSQEGEWDSNGQVLWIVERYLTVSNRRCPPDLYRVMTRGANWIGRKRTPDNLDEPHAGLLPAGFSAEHLGNNDFYYWDDFFAVAGLEAMARISERALRPGDARKYAAEARAMREAIRRSLERTQSIRRSQALPASPYRRLDAGAIGSLCASYPLALLPPDDSRMLATVHFLRQRCFVEGAFFQDMIHSGWNAYLTLHVAQALLRAGSEEFPDIVERVAELASPTGQWPEAIHPRTGGGCMGDGQHVWAAAEWAMMMRNLFVREEGSDLVIASGATDRLLGNEGTAGFGPSPTRFGPIDVTVERLENDKCRIQWKAEWHVPPRALRISPPGYRDVRLLKPAQDGQVTTSIEEGEKTKA